MKVAVNIQTKKIVDIMPDNATNNSSYLINNGYIMLDIENPILNNIENEDGTITATFRELTSVELMSYTLKDINKEYSTNAKSVVSGIPDDEVLTFPIQKEEAKAWFKDNSEHTPFIDGMLMKRTDVTKEQLVAKILAKADAYALAIGILTGDRQKQEKLILEGE